MPHAPHADRCHHPDLHGQPRHDAGRSARRRGDAAVLHETYGNAGSVHAFGDAARDAVERSRAVDRRGDRRRRRGDRLHQRRDREQQPGDPRRGRARRAGAAITSSASRTEHKAVLDPLARLGAPRLRSDAARRRAARQPAGRLARSAEVADAIRDDTCLVSRDARQQRDRRHPAARRDRRHLPRARRAAALRRDAGRRQDSRRRAASSAST